MNDVSEIRGFIFDLDGVITDTAEYHYLAWKRLADEEGLPFSREENDKLRGISRRDSLMILLGDRQESEDRIQEMMARKNQYYMEYIKHIGPGDLLPGAEELLDEIHSAGLKSALGSASKNAKKVVERLGIRDLFDAVSDGYSVVRQKPAPDLFVHAAGQINLPVSACIVFEDAAAGIQAAHAGGFHSVGIGPVERFSAPDAVFPNLKGVHLSDVLSAVEKVKV